MTTLQFPPGLFRGDTQYSTPGKWYDCNWMRFQGGSITPLGGWRRVTKDPLTSPARRIQMWNDYQDITQTIAGTADGLFQVTKDGVVDITPDGFAPWAPPQMESGAFGFSTYGQRLYGGAEPTPFFPTGYYWQMRNYGEWWVGVSTSDGNPCYWKPNNPDFAKAKIIPNAPKAIVSLTDTPQRSLLVVQPNGVANKIAVSAQENIEDWDYEKVNGTAVEIEFPTTAPLIAAHRIGDNIIVASNTEIWQLDYVGQPFMYKPRRLGLTTLINPNSITPAGNMVVWIGEQGIWQFDGGYIQPVQCPIINDVMNDINWDKIYANGFVGDLNYYPEVWFWYPSIRSVNGECDRYVIWNYVDNTWVWGSLGRSAMSSSAATKNPFMAGTDGNIFKHEIDNDWTDDGRTRIGKVWVESGYISAGSGATTSLITQAMASTEIGPSSIQLEFTSTYAPNGRQYRFGPYTQRPDGYFDTRVSGRDIKVRMFASADGPWSVGPLRLTVQPGGAR